MVKFSRGGQIFRCGLCNLDTKGEIASCDPTSLHEGAPLLDWLLLDQLAAAASHTCICADAYAFASLLHPCVRTRAQKLKAALSAVYLLLLAGVK